MKTQNIITKYHLNLLNFESPSALNCKYVLTSPRSLKACHKAGIKPVELLHRSLSDIEDELGVSAERAYQYYIQHERERQRKIETCQSVRHQLILEQEEGSYKKRNSFAEPIKHILSSRKDELDRENLLKAASEWQGNNKESTPQITTPKNHSLTSVAQFSEESLSDTSVSSKSISREISRNSSQNASRRSVAFDSSSGCSTPSTSPCQSTFTTYPKFSISRLGRDARSTPKSNLKQPISTNRTKTQNKNSVMNDSSWDNILSNGDKESVLNSCSSKTVKKKTLKSKSSDLSSYENILNIKNSCNLPSNKNSSDSTQSSAKSVGRNSSALRKSKDQVTGKGKINRTSQSKENKCTRKNARNSSDEKDSDTSKNSAKYSTIRNASANKNCTKRTIQNVCSNKLRKCHIPLHSSTLTLDSSSAYRKKHVLFDFMNIDNLSIPESDRRILENLALKKEQEHESEEYAHRAHQMWQKKREEELKAQNEQKLRWQKYVQEKRKSESVQNLLRMEEIKQSLRASQLLLEDSIQKRDERVAQLKQEQDERKKLEIIERRDQAIRKKAAVDANQKLKEVDVELQTQKHAEQLEKRLARAESSRIRNRLISHRRVASANRMEEVRHQEKMLEVLADMELQTIQKRRETRDREARTRERYSEIIKHRDRHIREARAEHEMREQQVREIHRDLQNGLEQWQDQVMLLQWADSQRAEACVQAQKENRRLKVEVDNKERQLQHSERMKKVKEAEDSKCKSVRDTIRAKDRRIHMLQQRREKEIQEGRTQAQTTADLREHLRRTLSPETFDRKVARVAMEMRIGSRPLTASPTMMRSHIYLG